VTKVGKRGAKAPSKSRERGRPRLAPRAERGAGGARLKAAADRVRISDFLSYRDYLVKLFETLKTDVPSYSYPQLGEDLGLSRSNVAWLIIKGKRRLTVKAAQRIAAALDLGADARRYLETLCSYANARRSDVREDLFRQLAALKSKTATSEQAQRTLEYFSEWHHPIIREMVGLEDFESDPAWIGARLVIPLMPMQILRSLQLLERLGLIVYDGKRGRHVQTGGQIHPDREVERIAAVRFHQRMCDMARESVTRVPEQRRELNTLTLCLSDDVAMKATAILYKACEQIMKLESEAKTKSEIYQVNVHLFPFTKPVG
jgi:uncharacterized protein (TIGR02147 family)